MDRQQRLPAYAAPRFSMGGEVELAGLPPTLREPWSDPAKGVQGRWTSSGRAALALVLGAIRREGTRRLHLPAFICASVVATAEAHGFSVSFYPVDLELRPQPDPPAGSAVLFVDYFGWRSQGLGSASEGGGLTSPIIEDASQALLSDRPSSLPDGHYLVLSPRKFAPVTLCGWCNVVDEELPSASCELEGLAWRSLAARLIKGAYLRPSDSPVVPDQEDFYLSTFAAVENYLDAHFEPEAIPAIALNLLHRTCWKEIAQARRRNWLTLQECLGERIEPLFRSLPDDVVPLGYVIRLDDRDTVKRELGRRRVFCPVHWPLEGHVSAVDFPAAALLSSTLLTLPIDQRYSREAIERLAEIVREVI